MNLTGLFTSGLAIAWTFFYLLPQVASAQQGGQNSSSPPPNAATQPITFTNSVERSFNIEPVVQRFKGQRGEIIPFSFQINSTGKPLKLSVMAVSLRQEESGIIVHDVHSPPPQQLRITSETSFSLAPGQSHALTGEVSVPLAKTNFLSYGLLVRDEGSVDQVNSDNDPSNSTTKASIRFITQYLLRVDLETRGPGVNELGEIKFTNGAIRSIDGLPVAEVFLENPTEFSLECTAKGELRNLTSLRPTPFSMGLASRASLSGDEKYLIRLMPKSRVRLFAPLAESLIPGEQQLAIELQLQNRKLLEQSFPVNVAVGEFPALAAQMAHLNQMLAIQPAQLELGTARGARRSVTLKIINNGESEQSLSLVPKDLRGSVLDNIKFSSDQVVIPPGRYKNVRMMIDSRKEALTSCGTLAVYFNIDGQPQLAGQLPVSLLVGEPATPQIEVSPLETVDQNAVPAFAVSVVNHGTNYVPVTGELRVSLLSGPTTVFRDGHGCWIAPGETRRLVFQPDRAFPEGEYQLSLFVSTTEEGPVSSSTLNVRFPINPATTLTSAVKQP